MDDAGGRWYALDVVRQKEYVAGYILNRMGYATFIPTETRWRRRNRYARAKVEVAFAAIPGVIFVCLPAEPNWPRLLGLSVITGVLSIADVPRPLDAGELWRYRAGQLDGHLVVERVKVVGRGGVGVWRSRRSISVQGRGVLRAPPEQRHMRSRREVRVGSQAMVADGPFRYVTVTVQQIVGARAKVLLPLFGSAASPSGGVSVTIAVDQLEAVA